MPFKCLITEQIANRNEEENEELCLETNFIKKMKQILQFLTIVCGLYKTTVAYKCSP